MPAIRRVFWKAYFVAQRNSRHGAKTGKVIKPVQDDQQGVRFHDNRIAIAKKHFLHIAVIIFRHADIFQYLGECHARGISRLCTFRKMCTDYGSNRWYTAKGSCWLRKRPVNISFVSQMILPLFFRFKIKSPGKEQPGSA